MEGGQFSSYANDELKAGDVLDVLPPTGKFNARLQENKAGDYLGIAAGSGITPSYPSSNIPWKKKRARPLRSCIITGAVVPSYSLRNWKH